MNIKFSGRGLAFLSHYMATNDIRYYLNGIFLTPMPDGPGVIGAATNGHVLGLWRDPAGEIDRPAILKVTKGLITACKKPETFLENVDGRLTCVQRMDRKAGYGEEIFVQPNTRQKPSDTVEAWEVEGTFPVLHRVTPKVTDKMLGMTGAISAQYLEIMSRSLIEAAKTGGFGRFGVATHAQQRTADGSILFLAPLVPEAVAVVMPINTSGMKIGSPWLESWQDRHESVEKARSNKLPGRQPSDAAPPPYFQKTDATGRYPE